MSKKRKRKKKRKQINGANGVKSGDVDRTSLIWSSEYVKAESAKQEGFPGVPSRGSINCKNKQTYKHINKFK